MIPNPETLKQMLIRDIENMETISFGTKDYKEIWENKETALKWLQSEVEE